MERNDALQSLCREYLCRLRGVAERHGLGSWLGETLSANRRGTCAATEEEVELLARCADDERVSRQEIPSMLGRSYRRCNEGGDFGRVRRLRNVGVYSKVSALLLSAMGAKKNEEAMNYTECFCNECVWHGVDVMARGVCRHKEVNMEIDGWSRACHRFKGKGVCDGCKE